MKCADNGNKTFLVKKKWIHFVVCQLQLFSNHVRCFKLVSEHKRRAVKTIVTMSTTTTSNTSKLSSCKPSRAVQTTMERYGMESSNIANWMHDAQFCEFKCIHSINVPNVSKSSMHFNLFWMNGKQQHINSINLLTILIKYTAKVLHPIHVLRVLRRFFCFVVSVSIIVLPLTCVQFYSIVRSFIRLLYAF